MISNNYLYNPPVRRVHDSVDAVDALVASGDCFITLATQLDQLTQVTTGLPGHESLEHVVKTLLDLQRRYRIVTKAADYRQ